MVLLANRKKRSGCLWELMILGCKGLCEKGELCEAGRLWDDMVHKAPSVQGSGIIGALYIAEPWDGCAPLTNKIVRKLNDTNSAFVLIIRGECGFEDKVRRAQAAGFNASIVYDNQADSNIISMAGDSAGISIPAVFVSKSSGETLAKYAGDEDTEIYILPSFEFSAWAIMAISFISLLALSWDEWSSNSGHLFLCEKA